VQLPALSIPVQVCPVAAVTVTSPVTVFIPLLTAKYTVTFRGFVSGTALVMVVVVASGVAVTDCVRLAAK
jgi:hypothetical protein